jgi:hypothetical protein
MLTHQNESAKQRQNMYHLNLMVSINSGVKIIVVSISDVLNKHQYEKVGDNIIS